MLGKTQQNKSIQLIEWTLFFGLCVLSAFFMHGVLDKFFSGKTSFNQSQEPIKELPTIMICFSKSNSRKIEYEYGSDFKIYYERSTSARNLAYNNDFLKEGENTTTMEEIVYLEKIITKGMGNCFKITAFSVNMNSAITYIILYFNKSSILDDFHTLDIFFTSEKNSYGVVHNWWRNGKVMKIQVDKNTFQTIALKQELYQYMETATHNKCSYESYYECISRIIAANLKCSLISLPSLPICKHNQSKEEFWSNWETATEQCPMNLLCNTLEYSGEEGYNKKLNKKDNKTVGFAYKISSNLVTIYEEYLIYDAISTVGSVGGTLGMCIGFSFTGVISFLINLIQKGTVLIKAKLAYQKLSKIKTQNGSMKKPMEIEISQKGKAYNSKILKYNENLHMENYLKIQNYQEDQGKLEEKLNATILDFFVLKKEVEGISNKLKTTEMKKNI